jgi:hypothetical protein
MWRCVGIDRHCHSNIALSVCSWCSVTCKRDWAGLKSGWSAFSLRLSARVYHVTRFKIRITPASIKCTHMNEFNIHLSDLHAGTSCNAEVTDWGVVARKRRPGVYLSHYQAVICRYADETDQDCHRETVT